jgi:hypothetical protein
LTTLQGLVCNSRKWSAGAGKPKRFGKIFRGASRRFALAPSKRRARRQARRARLRNLEGGVGFD